ncbi:MAG: tetratricopeptide repeat protein [Gammaproteobacteria bacterium]|nr:tetratricopeptide repeat protein [Gammaproteobacteria bacterium]
MSGNLQAAMALHRKGRLREAGRIYQKILQTQPEEVNSLHLLGVIRLAEGDAETARTLIDRAVRLHPGYAEAHLNLGSVYRALGQPREALACYDTALSLRSDLVDAHYNRGLVLHESGELDAALVSYRLAAALRPDHAEALSNSALVHLIRGDLAAGWPLYEWRLATPQFLAAHPQQLPGSRWTGTEPLAGRRILVFCEQGLGDAIQFSRYLPMLAERAGGAGIVVLARPPLHRLLGGLPGVARVIDDTRGEHFDFHCALLSLPGIFGTTLRDIPSATTPYLAPDAAAVDLWRVRLGDKTLPRVGLMWSGGSVTPIKGRSIPLAMLQELLALPAEFVSLQKELPAADAAALRALPQVKHYGDQQRDFADAAAIIAQLDLVISVDTSIAHLAAALGKETWIPLPRVADWRWLEDRSDSPWYPRVRLFRQTTAGDWPAVLAGLTRELAARL